MNTSNNRYKILVLSDLKKSSPKLLKNTMALAKMVNAEIDFFSVKKPLDLNVSESQLSTMRTLAEDYKKTNKKIQKIVDPFIAESGVHINHSFAVGNVKSEIFDYIEETKPDIIVLGKRSSNVFKIPEDSVVETVIDNYNGSILIVSNQNNLDTSRKLNLGVLNSEIESFQKTAIGDIFDKSERPYKYFRTSSNRPANDTKNSIVEYVFNDADNKASTFSNYIKRNKVDLLCCDRTDDNKTIINSIDVPVLINKRSNI